MASAQRLVSAPVVGCTTVGVLAPLLPPDQIGAVALGLYGDWVRVGIGVAPELSKSALGRSRDAVLQAAAKLGRSIDELDAIHHVGLTMLAGRSGQEAFCVGSAAAVPKLRFVGGCAATGECVDGPAWVWVNGEVMTDAGIVILLESNLPFQVVTSGHLVPTAARTVVTAAAGRTVYELDGWPAAPRLRELVAGLGDRLDEPRPSHAFARYIDGVPYVRSMQRIDTTALQLATSVDPGHVLRLMRPGDLIATTRRDLALAAERAGGTLATLIGFSCLGRHHEAETSGLAEELAMVYSDYAMTGLRTAGEQSGMLLVNHTLTGLAIGSRPL